MNNFSCEVIEIIAAIQRYIDENGNIDVIDQYYRQHGTYEGIAEYLKYNGRFSDVSDIQNNSHITLKKRELK